MWACRACRPSGSGCTPWCNRPLGQRWPSTPPPRAGPRPPRHAPPPCNPRHRARGPGRCGRGARHHGSPPTHAPWVRRPRRTPCRESPRRCESPNGWCAGGSSRAAPQHRNRGTAAPETHRPGRAPQSATPSSDRTNGSAGCAHRQAVVRTRSSRPAPYG